MRVCLFEEHAESLDPLTLTRPVFDLVCGLGSLGSKLLRHLAPAEPGMLIRTELAEWYRGQHPGLPVNDYAWLHAADVLLVNGRWLPPEARWSWPSGPCVGTVGGQVAYAYLSREQVKRLTFANLSDIICGWIHDLPVQAAGGGWIGFPWDLIHHNAVEIVRDHAARQVQQAAAIEPQHPLGLLGPIDRLHVSPGALLEPLIVVDTRQGPVIVDHGAQVAAFSRLEGPCYIGPFAQVHGAKIRGGTTVGPHCRVGGEIEASILHGHSNKYHDGFLGHSYVGEWVNLGAGTQTSDLRNDYGPVTVVVAGEAKATGQTKVGTFIGDHAKTGLGTLLNTGTNVGAFCNVLPAGRLSPKTMPAFTTLWNGQLLEGPGPESLLETARTVMRRRRVELTPAHERLYRHLHEATAAMRRRHLWEAEQKYLRRSA